MPGLHVAYTIDGGPRLPTYAHRSQSALFKILRIYTRRRFLVRTYEVPATMSTIADLITDKDGTLARLREIKSVTLTISERGTVVTDKDPPVASPAAPSTAPRETLN